MRKFYLTNAKGSRISLNEENMFLSLPSGLGFAYESEYVNLENAFIKSNRKITQKDITGTMSFDEYSDYTAFIKFIQYQPVILEYQPDSEDNSYYIDCYIESIDKGEMDVYLECPIQLKTITNFYKKKTYEIKQEQMEQSKKYNYTYPHIYNDTSGGAIQYINSTSLNHVCKIIIKGYAMNPHWQLMQNNEVLLEGRVNVTIESGNLLIIDSDPEKMEIAEYTNENEMIANRYGVSDFTTKRFVIFPPGTSELSFSHEADNALEIYIEVREEHESV